VPDTTHATSTLLFLAEEAPAAQPASPFGMEIFFLLAVVMVVVMLFGRRSQKRQAQEHQKMIEKLSAGTKVMLNSGMIALVDKVDAENQEVRLLIDEDKKVHARFNWAAITKVFKEETANVPAKEGA
jgi:preprotein translocase YajC subunit